LLIFNPAFSHITTGSDCTTEATSSSFSFRDSQIKGSSNV